MQKSKAGVFGLVVVATTLALACGSGGVDGACDAYADTLLSRAQTCVGDSPLAKEQAARLAAICKSIAAAPGSGFTDAVINDCAAKVKGAPCAAFGSDSLCQAPAGKLAVGAGCLEGSQCQSGSCQKPQQPPQGKVDCGTCVASATEGSDCTATPCAPGLACSGGKCARKVTVQAGEGCDGSVRVCAAGTFCGEARVCTTPAKAGEACVEAPCADGLGCIDGKCATPIPEGGACTLTSVRGCAPGTFCNVEAGKCGKITYGAAGAACNPIAGQLCASGQCGENRTCPTVIPDGQACTLGDTARTCQAYARCIDGKCQIPDPNACK